MLLQISQTVFVNADSIDALEANSDGVVVLVGDRSFIVENPTSQKIKEIKDAVGSSAKNLHILARNAQNFGG